MGNPSCEACRFWCKLNAQNSQAAGLQTLALNGDVGQCRWRPPVPFLVPGNVAGSIGMRAFWPLTGKDEWCGEWCSAPSRLT